MCNCWHCCTRATHTLAALYVKSVCGTGQALKSYATASYVKNAYKT